MRTYLFFIASFAYVFAQYDDNYPKGYQINSLGESQEKDYHDEPSYNYEYKVDDHSTGDYKTHQETREGDVVKGFYSMREADGTMREVHYTADKINGFNAIVKKIGTPTIQEPKYPIELESNNHKVYLSHNNARQKSEVQDSHWQNDKN